MQVVIGGIYVLNDVYLGSNIETTHRHKQTKTQ